MIKIDNMDIEWHFKLILDLNFGRNTEPVCKRKK